MRNLEKWIIHHLELASLTSAVIKRMKEKRAAGQILAAVDKSHRECNKNPLVQILRPPV